MSEVTPIVKIFPFINLTDFFKTLFDFGNENFLNYWWIFITILYFSVSLIILYLRLANIKNHLKSINENFSLDNAKKINFLKYDLEHYEQSFIEYDDIKKTTLSSDNFFSSNIIISNSINIRYWNSVSNVLVGFGILGTFVGLTVGITGFQMGDVEKIKLSIQGLLSGMSTAFVSSVWGMATSMSFTVLEKYLFNTVQIETNRFCSLLDRKFLINRNDEFKIFKSEQQNLLKQFMEEQKELIKKQFSFYLNDNTEVNIGMAFRELLDNSKKQTLSLKQFTTDLSDGLNLSDQTLKEFKEYQEEIFTKFFVIKDENNVDIYPSQLFYELRKELIQQTKALKSFSSDLADGIKISTETIASIGDEFVTLIEKPFKTHLSPSLDKIEIAVQKLKDAKEESSGSVIEKIVSDLQISLQKMGEQLHQSLSGSAVSQLEQLAGVVSNSSTALNSLPNQINQMMLVMEEQVNKTKTMIELSLEASNKNAEKQLENTNKFFESLMQEMRNGLENQQKVVQFISDKMGENAQIATKTMSDYVRNSAKELGDVVGSLQENMKEVINNQNESSKYIENLLDNTKDMIDKTKEANDYVVKSLSKVNENLIIFDDVTRKLNNSTNILESSGLVLKDSTQEFKNQIVEFLSTNKQVVQQLENSLKQAQSVADNYSNKFKIIESGLGNVFGQIQNGLSEYQKVTRESLNDYLSDFSEKLSKSSSALSGSVENLQEVVDEVSDMVEKIVNRR